MPMYRKRRAMRKRRAGRRKPAIRRPKSSGARLIHKTYTYKMTPNPTYITSDTNASGVVLTSALSAPVIGANINAPVPSKTGFAGFYDFGVSVPFSLADLANYSSFTGLYDQYKINSVTLDLQFLSNSAQVNGFGLLPTVYAIVDEDDAVTPLLQSTVTGRQGHRIFKFGDGDRSSFKINIRPQIAVINQATVNPALPPTAFGRQQSINAWVDCNSPTVQYFGLKLWFTDVLLLGNPAVNTAFKWNWTYNVSFKGARNEF